MHVYLALHVYLILTHFPPCTFVRPCTFIRHTRVIVKWAFFTKLPLSHFNICAHFKENIEGADWTIMNIKAIVWWALWSVLFIFNQLSISSLSPTNVPSILYVRIRCLIEFFSFVFFFPLFCWVISDLHPWSECISWGRNKRRSHWTSNRKLCGCHSNSDRNVGKI